MYLRTLLLTNCRLGSKQSRKGSKESDYRGVTVLMLFSLMFRCSVLHAPCSGDPGLDGLELVLSGVTLRTHWVGSD